MLASLAEPWREVLLPGWEAYDAGTIPVGAVVVGADGVILSRPDLVDAAAATSSPPA